METVGPRRLKVYDYVPKTFKIYRKEEADEAGIEYREDYANAEFEDWVLSEDGWVFQCVKRTEYPQKNIKELSVELRFPHRRIWVRKKLETGELVIKQALTYDDFRESERNAKGLLIGDSNPKTFGERAIGRRKVQQIIRLAAATMVSNRRHLTLEDHKFLGTLWKPDDPIPAATSRRLFKQPEVQRELAKEITKIVSDYGITPEDILDMYMESADIARETRSANTLKQVADSLAKMIGIDEPRKIKEHEHGDFLQDAEWAEVIDEEVSSHEQRKIETSDDGDTD